jgi:DNA polymerase-3 subunit alpha
LIKIDDLISHSLKNELDYVSIVDVNILYGAYDLYQKALESGLKPIIGLEIDVEEFKGIFIARNYDGYKELMKISSQINTSEKIIIDDSNLIQLDTSIIKPSAYINKSDLKTLELFSKIGSKDNFLD